MSTQYDVRSKLSPVRTFPVAQTCQLLPIAPALTRHFPLSLLPSSLSLFPSAISKHPLFLHMVCHFTNMHRLQARLPACALPLAPSLFHSHTQKQCASLGQRQTGKGQKGKATTQRLPHCKLYGPRLRPAYQSGIRCVIGWILITVRAGIALALAPAVVQHGPSLPLSD